MKPPEPTKTADLPPYSGHSGQCPKCGLSGYWNNDAKPVVATHHQAAGYPRGGCTCEECCETYQEHMLRVCTNCHYTWKERPKDPE